MKVLLVNGSPHKQGCTYTALNEVAKSLNENDIDTKIFWIGNKPIGGCIACKSCVTKGKCIFNDIVNEFLDIAINYDGFIFGTPVHWGAMAGNMASFMDRVFYADFCSNKQSFLLKPTAGVISARRAGTTATFDQINKYFTINCMPVVGSQYWNQVHGGKAEEVKQDEEGMQTMRTLGNNMAWLLKSLEAGKAAGIAVPQAEDKIKTNFIR